MPAKSFSLTTKVLDICYKTSFSLPQKYIPRLGTNIPKLGIYISRLGINIPSLGILKYCTTEQFLQ